jgi:hypothetical protein
MTGVQIRRGPLLASVAVMRTDGRSENARALALARALEARIVAVRAGRITTPPANLARLERGPKRVKPKVDISVAALTRADLDGAEVVRQGHVADASSVATYEREFDAVRLGASRLTSVQAGVSLFGSVAETKAAIERAPSVFSPRNTAFRNEFVRELAEEGGLVVEKLSVVGEGTARFGGALAYHVTLRLETPIGPFDAAYVFVASGRFFGHLALVSEPGARLARADVVRLGARLAQRMAAASKKLALPVA